MREDFGPKRWDRVRETYRLFWKGELERPVVPVELVGRDPGRERPDVPPVSQATCSDRSVPVSSLVEFLDYELATRVYLGDSFPYVSLDSFGPGVAAAFCGANMRNSMGHVWFEPEEVLPIGEIHLEYDPENVWLRRVKGFCRRAVERWEGRVLVGMPDLGGTLDILSTFRRPEGLLLDLYDHPEEVKRVTREIHELWHRFYTEVDEVLRPANPGYSDWSSLYSDEPCYILQCDMSYMIGPAMFEEFVVPELRASCERLTHSFYHLDGPGQLPHLDHLLSIEELDGIQWVPGEGHPGEASWHALHERIHRAGKRLQLIGGLDSLDTLITRLGTGRSIQHRLITMPIHEEAAVRRRLESYGVE